MLLIKSIKKMKKSYNVISVMLSRLAFVCKRVLAKCGFNCFKAAEHRGDSREENSPIQSNVMIGYTDLKKEQRKIYDCIPKKEYAIFCNTLNKLNKNGMTISISYLA